MTRAPFLVGAFPPPVHGMAVANAAIRDQVAARGVDPVVHDLAPASLDRALTKRLRRLTKVATAFRRYAGQVGGDDTLYVGLSGGWGQMYELLFVGLARLRGARTFLHHHSFAYLDRTTVPAWLLTRIAGPQATHVVLCETMEASLRTRYPVGETRVISNAAIVLPARPRTRTRLERIGFLGNISREKGIDEVLAVARALPSLETVVAGPCADPEIRRGLDAVRYIGPAYGADKEAFWDRVDVLLFPSRYDHEAAPLVVYEALAHGVPVIAWNRGCLANIVSARCGALIDRDQDFIAHAIEQLVEWQRDPKQLEDRSRRAAESFAATRAQALASRTVLVDALCEGHDRAR